MKQAFTGLILAAMTALVLSCTTEKADDFVPVIGGSSGSTGVAGGGSIPYTVDPGTTCPMPHVTRTCTCNKDGQEVPGRQVCKGLPGWGTCECAAVPESIVTGTTSAIGDPAKNKGAATFEWQRTVPEGSCEAGFYQGSFTGIYNSQVLIT